MEERGRRDQTLRETHGHPEIKTEAQTLHETCNALCSVPLALIPTNGPLWQTGFSHMKHGGAWGSCTSCLETSSESVQSLAEGNTPTPPSLHPSPPPWALAPPPQPTNRNMSLFSQPPQTWPSLLAVLSMLWSHWNVRAGEMQGLKLLLPSHRLKEKSGIGTGGGREDSSGSLHIDRAHTFPPRKRNWLPDSSSSEATVLSEMGEELWGNGLQIRALSGKL